MAVLSKYKNKQVLATLLQDFLVFYQFTTKSIQNNQNLKFSADPLPLKNTHTTNNNNNKKKKKKKKHTTNNNKNKNKKKKKKKKKESQGASDQN